MEIEYDDNMEEAVSTRNNDVEEVDYDDGDNNNEDDTK